jgi:hypothetical protein
MPATSPLAALVVVGTVESDTMEGLVKALATTMVHAVVAGTELVATVSLYTAGALEVKAPVPATL